MFKLKKIRIATSAAPAPQTMNENQQVRRKRSELLYGEQRQTIRSAVRLGIRIMPSASLLSVCLSARTWCSCDCQLRRWLLETENGIVNEFPSHDGS